MKQMTLNGNWNLSQVGAVWVVPAEVPGSMYGALLAAGRMEDPYWRDNEMAALSLMEHDYIFTREFEVDVAMLEADRLLLRCEGLDTLCEISLNNSFIAKTDNMHRTWEFDVKNVIKFGKNEISLVFLSPIRFIREAQGKCFIDGSSDAMSGFPHLRKAHCMFGWDWGPRLPDCGIWRDISLVAVNSGRIESVYVTQEHTDNRVTLHVKEELEFYGAESFELRASIKAPDGETVAEGSALLVIENPQLWWPCGYGAQPLYTIRVELLIDGKPTDVWERRIGLRTLMVAREKDEWGEGFCFRVNGVDIFAMGADYIPEDNLLGRVNRDRTKALLLDCTAANMNSIRVWGGGTYPSDDFFDTCDELGLLVWQDFMFCCAMYELDLPFEQNIRAELIDNIKRLRHHASLGLWCGNNEMEWQVDDKVWRYTHKQYSDYIRMYEHVFPEILREHDPVAFYWPASPSSGGGFDYPNDPDRGDVHYWDVWHGGKPFSDYRNYHFRFASEFGFQSFPSIKTVESFTEPSDRNIFSYVMEKHQRNNAANGKIMNYMGENFLYPTSFETLLYASQLLQAEAIKYGVEHWRRHRGRCMGAIYWQLNDCWPVASWASIDYFGRWKALHYYAKRFFAPVMLSCCEDGIITQNTNVNAEPYPVRKSARLSVANETMAEFSGKVAWTLRDAKGKALQSGEICVTVSALSSVWLEKLDFGSCELYENYFSYALHGEGGEEICDGSVLFCPPKHFRFGNPDLTATIDGDNVTVRAKAYARSVEIDFEDADVLLSDNYFDLHGGKKTVKILRGKPGKLTLRSVYDIR